MKLFGYQEQCINFIKSESNKSINEYNLSLIDLYKKYKKLYKFQNMYLFIT